VLVLVLAAPACASAATRLAGEGGDQMDPTCTVVVCTLDHAVAIAQANDTVSVAPGDYGIEGTLAVPSNVVVEGAPGQPRPTLASGGGPPTVTAANGATLRHLAIRQDAMNATALQATPGGAVTLTDLIVQAAGPGSTAVSMGGLTTLTNSVAWASGTGGTAVVASGFGTSLHNVTAYGDGVGIQVAISSLVTATNTIARATSPNSDLAGEGSFDMTKSNFASVDPQADVTETGTQSATPLLANPGAGNFHQLHGSPTIDAGVADPLSGASDFDGDPRVLGAGIDIGADEYVLRPPSVLTTDPIAVTTSGGTLTGAVNPNGLPTSYHFDYGPTPAYGSSTPAADAGSGTGSVQASAGLGNLAPGSIVHYRLVATNADGQTVGLDRVLIVLTPTPVVPPPGNGPTFTAISLPTTATVGQPITLRVSGSDPDSPVNAIAIDFGDGPGFFAESACRLTPADPIFDPNRTTDFAIPYTFARPGPHTVTVTIGSGGCGASKQSTTQTITIDVAAPKTRVARARAREAAVTAAADCKGADLVPNKRNTKLVEKATICLLNKQRAIYKLKKFKTNKLLRKAGTLHNGYMIRGKFFAHQGPGEPPLAARFRKVKYRGGGGENLAIGVGKPASTPRSMVMAWMNSPVHRANILERRFFTIGLAVVAQKPFNPSTPGATYTTEFGTTKK
jgi:uncharacterized protein YkwD